VELLDGPAAGDYSLTRESGTSCCWLINVTAAEAT
jgi:hypothetical protein